MDELNSTNLSVATAPPRGIISVSPRRPMRMEVLIPMPAYLQRKREPVKKSKHSALPSRKRAVESRNEAARPPTRKRKAQNSAGSDLEDAIPLRRRRFKKKSSSPDENCSGDEVEPEHILKDRFRDRGKLSQRDLALRKLRRKRQGLSPAKSESEPGSSDGSVDEERDSLFDGSSSDSDPSDFIVDDGGAPLPLPKEFSMETHQDLSHQFKKIFQLFVHVAVRAPVERKEFMEKMLNTEDYFSVPLNAARRRISSLRGTLVASSRWRPDLIALLEKYPDLDMQDLSSSTPACDVCGIKSRRACKFGRLSGFPYESAGFQDKKNKKMGNREFNLGRFCAERISIYHQIAHWENELFKTIKEEIDQLHERSEAKGVINDRDKFVPIKHLGGKKPPDDLTDADAIYDWLVERNIVDMEWAKIKAMQDRARNLEIAAKKGQTD
ncbi:hypothetical protein B0H11DRAFT_2073150 [Mycena galericulata]|nr:hypothetical protein B0H11DRAFT_2073150 [Mycena galericulata]